MSKFWGSLPEKWLDKILNNIPKDLNIIIQKQSNTSINKEIYDCLSRTNKKILDNLYGDLEHKFRLCTASKPENGFCDIIRNDNLCLQKVSLTNKVLYITNYNILLNFMLIVRNSVVEIAYFYIYYQCFIHEYLLNWFLMKHAHLISYKMMPK